MAIMFSGTFDDSGDHDDLDHNSASFGGYIGPIEDFAAWEVRKNISQKIIFYICDSHAIKRAVVSRLLDLACGEKRASDNPPRTTESLSVQ
jgi:hypothetical protein